MLLLQDLIELQLTYCSSLSSRSLRTLSCFRETLVSLCLFGCRSIFYRRGAPLACGEDAEDEDCPASRPALETDFNFQGFRRLRLLSLEGLPEQVDVETLLKPLRGLSSLELANLQLLGTSFLSQWRDRLASLVLYNVDLSEELLSTVVELLHLRCVCVSLSLTHTHPCLLCLNAVIVGAVIIQTSGHIEGEQTALPQVQDEQEDPDVHRAASGQPGFPGHLWSHDAGQLHRPPL